MTENKTDFSENGSFRCEINGKSAPTLDTLLKWGTARLEAHEIMNASLDAWYLMEHIFKVSRVDYLLTRDRALEGERLAAVSRYEAMIKERCGGRPVQYLTGGTEFMGLYFEVNAHVLIPRQDTEILAETALDFLKPDHRVLDMCTGSGCIILSLAALGHLMGGAGADISAEALAVARRNRERHGLHQIEMIQSDLFENISGRYDMIVSNPPYIPTGEISGLMREVRDYEPHLALDGSADGLAFYRRIAAEAGDYLKPGGMLMLEIGWNQAQDIMELLKAAGYGDIRLKQDLAGLDRVVYGIKG